MSRLEIGVVCLASLGGSGTVAVELAQELAARGHRVTVLAEARPPRLRDASVGFAQIVAPEHPLFAQPDALALAATLIARHRERPFDVVHLHYGVPHAVAAHLVRETLGTSGPALVLTLHGTDVTTFGADARYASVIAACLRSVDAITTPSAFLQRATQQAFDVAPIVVPNSVDGRVFRPEAADRARVDEIFGGRRAAATLVHVSNFRPVKQTRALVPMMQHLTRALPGGARLLLVGDGPERDRVEADARAAGIGDALRFVAPADDPATLASWIAACDLFVLPSEIESFGLAALEALACGVPVLAQRVGGLPEVVRDGVTGVLVDALDALPTAAETLLRAPASARTAMSIAAARDARERFSPGATTDAYEAVHRRALGAFRSPRSD
ncbi:N-acetyl-alpha-D-glucosaminyl L-malate synthase BshA [Sandaracinus amylolyticus]|uniref:Glycosyltransferase n=1 Tax=Sandaracinus amylolyticus TaxID=927083 RepID=A0A0F6VZQ4_9BACT|nr:N-acetyl-alpha-D-glucosaminyl L-malate synthase BshA [Sandaracinus amylolyticus]AKF03558.1 Glycosyltransferase [Sandaracinus amylolyticus]